VKQYRNKELLVVDYVKNKFSELQFSFNKTVQNGCSKRRPDILLELNTHCIIIEIDENQHIDYETNCEEQRINDLFNDIGLPIIFIRFNPDSYKINDRNITSCFTNTGVVKKSKETEWIQRLETLKTSILQSLNDTDFSNSYVKIKNLFYDQ